MAIQVRSGLVSNVFGHRDNKNVNVPVSFIHNINNVQGQQNININSLVDITPKEAYEIIDNGFNNLMSIHYCKPNILFKFNQDHCCFQTKLLTFCMAILKEMLGLKACCPTMSLGY